MDPHEHQVWLMAYHATMSRYRHSASYCAQMADEAVEEYKKSIQRKKDLQGDAY